MRLRLVPVCADVCEMLAGDAVAVVDPGSPDGCVRIGEADFRVRADQPGRSPPVAVAGRLVEVRRRDGAAEHFAVGVVHMPGDCRTAPLQPPEPRHLEVIVGVCVEDAGRGELFEVSGAFDLLGGGARLIQRRQQHRSQNRDDRNNHQQLDQSERFAHNTGYGKFPCTVFHNVTPFR